MEEKNTNRYNVKLDWILYIPIILLLAVVPFVVRMSLVELDPVTAAAFKSEQVVDFFSNYKSIIIMILAGVCLVMLFLMYNKSNLKKSKQMLVYMIGIGLFLGFSLLATIFSEYKQVAIWGGPDRCEGMVTIAAYVIILLYTIYAVNRIEDYRYIIYPLCILVVGTGILGVFQYAGKDLLLGTEFGNKLIVPDQYAQVRGQVAGTYEKGKIYGTMFHYNYIGSFGAMVVPLFATLTLFVKGNKNKILFGIMTIISLFILLGSTSRAGLIGLMGAIIVFIIVFSKKIIKGYKIVVPVVLGVVALLFVFNSVTGGTIFERIPTLVNDAFGLFTASDKNFDYKDHIPVRDIKNHDGMVTFETQDDSITLVTDGQTLSFVDKNNQPIAYALEDKFIKTQDPRFANIIFEVVNAEAGKVPNVLKMLINDRPTFVVRANEQNEMYLADSYTGEKLDLAYPETIGFNGKERIGSARGYIWSRSLPMVKETLLLGNGPDTYLVEFPQDDLLGKYYAYETPNMTVDKPHNLYLQIAINNGVVALLGFLVLVIAYVIDSLRLYTFKGYYNMGEIMGIGIMLAIVGYMGAGVFNDSIVSVAPIFWILLGVGIAINYLINKERISIQKKSEHAIINMKNGKHI